VVRTVIRYEGEGLARRPIYRDEGPARAGGTSEGGVGRFAIATMPDPDRDRESYIGTLRREVYGRAETWSEERDRNMAARLARQAEEHEETAPMTAIAEDRPGVLGTGFADLDVDVALPCEGCLHVPVCRIREQLLALPLGLVAHRLPAGVHHEIVVELRCDYRLAEPEPRATEKLEAIRQVVEAPPPELPVDEDPLEDRQELMERQVELLRAQDRGELPSEGWRTSAIDWHRDLCSCPRKGTCEPHGWAGTDGRRHGGICMDHDHVDVEARSADADAEARLARVVAPKTDPETIAAHRAAALHGDNVEHASSPYHRRERRAGEIRMQHEEEQRQRAGKHGLTPKQERALELLREHDGSFTRVAERLGVTAGAISSLAKGIRAKGRMPADVDAMLAARAHPPAEASA
jgi:DNA-binding CsgD family transcriptional regulator